MFKVLILCLFFCSVALCADSSSADGETSTAAAGASESANHEVATTSSDKHPTILGFPTELGFLPSGLIGHVITGGAVAIGVVVIVLLASLFYPFASVKNIMCDWTGSCPPSSNYRVDSYPTPGVLSANTNTYSDTYNSPYSQQGAAYSPTYQKRSLEYVGPILKMLNAAYDKYASKPHHANSISSHISEKAAQEKVTNRRKR